MNFNGSLIGKEGKNEYMKNYDMSGREMTIKTPKMVKNIENCPNHISKVSRNMSASQFDMCFYIVNKVGKERLKNDKKLGKICPKSLT